MLQNLSPEPHYRSAIQRHRRRLRKMGYEKNIVNQIGLYKFIRPTQYVGVYEGDIPINSWCKQLCYHEIPKYRNSLTIENIRERIKYDENTWYFGVADNIEQVIEFYNKNEDDRFKGNHVVMIRNIVKGCNGGWRWHKWGPYIGTQHPRAEYLDDEPEIESVIVFEIFKIR